MVSLHHFSEHANCLRTTGENGWIDMSIGSPKHEIPSFIREIIDDNFTEFQNYPQRMQT